MENYQQPLQWIQKNTNVINYIQFSELKMSEVEEEILPFLSNLSLSRQAVSLVDPFRDDPTSEDDNAPDIDLSDTSEEGSTISFIFYLYPILHSDITKKFLCTCTNCKEMPTVLESGYVQN